MGKRKFKRENEADLTEEQLRELKRIYANLAQEFIKNQNIDNFAVVFRDQSANYFAIITSKYTRQEYPDMPYVGSPRLTKAVLPIPPRQEAVIHNDALFDIYTQRKQYKGFFIRDFSSNYVINPAFMQNIIDLPEDGLPWDVFFSIEWDDEGED